jgi:hypothetical protein
MTRKELLISLGAGIATAIAGYLVGPRQALASPPGSLRPGARPCLRGDVTLAREDGLLTLRRGDDPHVHGAVNEPGERVVRLLDGYHTVEEIAAAVARDLGVRPSEETVGAVAHFIAELGMLSFLEAPFYAVIATRVEA